MPDTLDEQRNPEKEEQPQVSPLWIAKSREYFSEAGLAEIDKALAIYSGYTIEQFEEDPSIHVEAALKGHEHIEAAVHDLIAKIRENFVSKSGILKKDIMEIMIELSDIFRIRDPAAIDPPPQKPGYHVINEIAHRIKSYLIAIIVAKEKEHRDFSKQKKNEAMATKSLMDKLSAAQEKRRQLVAGTATAGDGECRLKIRELQAVNAECAQLKARLTARPGITIFQDQSGKENFRFNPGIIPLDRFFEIVDTKGGAVREMASLLGEAVEYLISFFYEYAVSRDTIKRFFDIEAQNLRQPRPGTNLKEDNDRVFALLKKEEVREIPMCTATNKTLTRNEPLVMQFSPVESGIGRIHEYSAVQVTYHPWESGKKVRADMEAQKRYRPISVGSENDGMALVIGNPRFPSVFLRRADGELRTLGADKEALKLLAEKNPQAYELLRKDILFYLAQLTCRPETLRKMFGDKFVEGMPIAGRDKKHRARSGAGEPDKDGEDDSEQDTGPAKRRYPYGQMHNPTARAAAVFEALKGAGGVEYLTPVGKLEAEVPMSPEEIAAAIALTRREIVERGEAVEHKALLALIRGQDGEILGACHPSEQAKERARKHGKTLKRGVEFPQYGQVFYPENVQELIQKFGITPTEKDPDGLDQLVAMHPGKAFIRYETWVDPPAAREARIAGADAPDVVKRAVIAKVRRAVPGNDSNPE